jgi:hypothetical protein
VVGGGYYCGGDCDPNYQYCGTGGYYGAEFIEGARSSEGALLCEAGLQYVGGARMLPIVVIVVVDAEGKHNFITEPLRRCFQDWD